MNILVSGGFDPVHVGHLRMFQHAKNLGDKLIIILNNDSFLSHKKGYVFMPYEERQEVLYALKGVVDVVEAQDSDDTVCKSLEKMLPDFVSGSDITKVLENYEVGTKERRDHTIKTTPGQSVEDFEKQVNVMHKKKNSMREAIAKMWGVDEGHNPFDKNGKKDDNKDMKKEKMTMTGQPKTKVEVEPKIDEKKK